jgi:hypothetical protein
VDGRFGVGQPRPERASTARLGRERRNITKGQKAMGYAMLFPVAPTAQERGARKGKAF